MPLICKIEVYDIYIYIYIIKFVVLKGLGPGVIVVIVIITIIGIIKYLICYRPKYVRTNMTTKCAILRTVSCICTDTCILHACIIVYNLKFLR